MSEPVKNARGPEPFEHRRMEAMGIREERPAYGEKKQKSEWILLPKPLTRGTAAGTRTGTAAKRDRSGSDACGFGRESPGHDRCGLGCEEAVPAEQRSTSGRGGSAS
ncbi:MAG: hypothetical protein ACLUAR_20790 [Pilosibacter sp.]